MAIKRCPICASKVNDNGKCTCPDCKYRVGR